MTFGKSACLFEQILYACPILIGFLYVGWMERWHSYMLFDSINRIFLCSLLTIQPMITFSNQKIQKIFFLLCLLALFLSTHPLDDDHGGDDGEADGVCLQARRDHQ